MNLRKLFTGLAPALLALACVAALLPGLSVQAAAVTPTVTPASGVVGTIVNVTAIGLTASSPYTLMMGAYIVSSGTTTAGGAVNATFTVGNLPRGVYVIDLNTTGGDTTANPKPTFTVGASLSINQTQGPSGSSFTVTGYGFTASTAYSILFNGNPVSGATGTTDSQGHFSKAVSTAGLPRASYAVTATTTFSGDTAYAGTFTVLPVLSVSPLTGVCGNPVQVSGAGFAASQTVTIYYDSIEAATVTASTTGTFSNLPVVVPVSRAGAHVFTARDNAVTADAINFTVIPRLSADPVSGSAGDTVSLQGHGFNTSAAISLYWDDTLASSGLTTDTNGSFSLSDFTVPAAAGGSHTFKAVDNAGNNASFSFAVGSRLSLSPATGGPGTAVTVNGNSFQAGQTVTVSFNGAAITTNPAAITANSLGGFSAVIVVPGGPAGTYEVTAGDGTNSASADFITTSSISISPATSDAAPVFSGGTLTVAGAGFVPQSIVSLQVEGLAGTLASPTAGNDGSFTASFTVPALTGGLHRVVATGSNEDSVTANFIVGPRIEAVPQSAAPGATVDISGTGFTAGKTITLKLGGQPLAISPAGVTVDGSGSFAASFEMPGLAAGTRQLTASDSLSQASLDFTTAADVTPTQGGSTADPGYVGMQVPLSGAGFSPNSLVTITYDNPAVTLGSATTDANGAFSTTVTIPVSARGNHVITVQDNAATPVMKQFTFVISTSAPPAPQLLLPEIDVRQGSHPTFTWQDVAMGDAADTMNLPVTYTLQISPDKSFQSLIMEKSGLASPSFTPGELEGLESTSGETPYYWRVRTTDSAGNESNWSVAQPFHVGFIFAFEGWVVWLCLGLSVLVAFGAGLFLGQGPGRMWLIRLWNTLKLRLSFRRE